MMSLIGPYSIFVFSRLRWMFLVFALTSQTAFALKNDDTSHHTQPSLQGSVQQAIDQNPQMIVEQKIGSELVRIVVSDVGESSRDEIQNFIENTQQKFDTVISTDDEQVFKASVESSAKSIHGTKVLPFGLLTNAKSKFNQFIDYHSGKVKNNIKYDKIGLTVALISVGIDSFYWIHSSALDVHQKSSLVTFNLLLCATFGVNPDLWPATVRPLKEKVFNTLSRFNINWKHSDKTATVISQYVANFALSSFVQTTRVSLMSMDHLLDAVSTSNFWFSAVGISALATMTQFSWSELSASVDMSKYPKSVIMLRRLTNFRVILLAQLASMSQVLQPGVYGYSPMMTLIVSGGLGLVALLSSDRIVNFLESDKTIDVLYRQNQKVEAFLQSMSFAKKRSRVILSCEMLFN